MNSRLFSSISSQLNILLVFALILLVPGIAITQHEDPFRCGMDKWLETQMANPDFARKFQQTETKFRESSGERSPSCSNPVILPVAIHWGTDIVDVPCLLDMAENQIQVLNEDFGGYNPDITNYCDHAFSCPEHYAFEAVTGGTCIQFCLATQNHPAGSGLSDGEPAFTFGQYTFHSEAPIWDGYVNIFVSTIPPSGYGSSLLGLAPLYGGANPDGNGVWVNAKAFGGFEEECTSGSVTVNSYNNYDLGRTTTHELGHYFGLYHTFQGCGYGDGIPDTPSQSEPNYGSPVIGPDCLSDAENTCNTQDFFFNYMDYTYDVSMYMFTSDQSDLMYDVALDGNYKFAATTCGSLPDDYSPIFPGGCYECPVLSIETSQENTSCFEACDGSLSVDDVPGGVAPFAYNWSNGEDTPVIDGLCAGDYSVTVNDVYGCEITFEFTITEPAELAANATSTPETANNFEDGTASANPTGGTSPYYYLWSNGATSQYISGLAPGEYTVTVSDAHSCESIETVLVEEFICPALSILSEQSNIICFDECNGSIEVTDVTNGVSPFDYNWSNGVYTAVNSDLCQGDYTVTVTDYFNCPVVSNVFTIIEPPLLTVETTSENESSYGAEDGLASANPAGGVAPYDYIWSNGGYGQTIFLLSPGMYYVTVTDHHGCQVIDSAEVETFTCPDLSLSVFQENVACFGECNGWIEISDVDGGFGPFTFDWSNGDNNSIASDLCGGVYYVTITDYFNCPVIDSFAIIEPDALLSSAYSTDETAFMAHDGTASVEATGGTEPYIFSWSNGSFNPYITGLNPGDYTVTVSDVNGCESIQSITVQPYICPELSLLSESENLLCFGSCTGSITITEVVNGNGTIDFHWDNGGAGPQLTGLCAGTYQVTVTDPFNCSTVDSYTLTEPAELFVNASATGETAYATGDGTAQADPSGGVPPYSFAWSNGFTGQFLTDLIPGAYTVTVTDANACERIQTVNVSAFSCDGLAMEWKIENNPCFGDCLGSISVTGLINGTEPYSYNWNNGAITPELNGLCAGEYSLTLTDAANCSLQQSFTITEPGEIIIILVALNPVTSGGPGSIDIETDDNYRIEWSGPSEFHAETEDLSGVSQGCYTVTVTNPETGCSVDSTFCVEDLTGVNSFNPPGVEVFPNPAMDRITIRLPENMAPESILIHVLDLNGRIIPARLLNRENSNWTFDTSDIMPGLYLIRLVRKDELSYIKIIIQNE